MKKLLETKNIVGVNPTQVIDKDGSVIVDYCETIKKDGSIWDRLEERLKDGPAWDRLNEMLGE